MKHQNQVILSLEDNRLYLSAYQNGATGGAVSTKIDVTPVWNFFKQSIEVEEEETK